MADFFHITTLVTLNSPGCEGLYLKDWHFVHTYQSKGQEAVDGGKPPVAPMFAPNRPETETENASFQEEYPFPGRHFQVVCWFSGVYTLDLPTSSTFITFWMSFVAAYFLSSKSCMAGAIQPAVLLVISYAWLAEPL